MHSLSVKRNKRIGGRGLVGNEIKTSYMKMASQTAAEIKTSYIETGRGKGPPDVKGIEAGACNGISQTSKNEVDTFS